MCSEYVTYVGNTPLGCQRRGKLNSRLYCLCLSDIISNTSTIIITLISVNTVTFQSKFWFSKGCAYFLQKKFKTSFTGLRILHVIIINFTFKINLVILQKLLTLPYLFAHVNAEIYEERILQL